MVVALDLVFTPYSTISYQTKRYTDMNLRGGNSVNTVKFHIYLEYYPKVHIKSRFTFIKVGESAQYMKNSLIFNFCTIARIDSILLVMKLYET